MSVISKNEIILSTPMTFGDLEKFVQLGHQANVPSTRAINVTVTEKPGGDFRESWSTTVVTITANA